jgi:hypothetical protein
LALFNYFEFRTYLSIQIAEKEKQTANLFKVSDFAVGAGE